MPRKKSLETTTSNSEATPAVVTKKPTKKAAAAKKAVETTPPKKSKKKRVDLGPPLDPASLEGANEQADSLLGKTLSFKANWSSGPGLFHFRFKGTAKATDRVERWWRQCGAAVVFESEPMQSRYIGRVDGNTCSGTALNTNNKAWTWQGEFTGVSKPGVSDLFLRE